MNDLDNILPTLRCLKGVLMKTSTRLKKEIMALMIVLSQKSCDILLDQYFGQNDEKGRKRPKRDRYFKVFRFMDISLEMDNINKSL